MPLRGSATVVAKMIGRGGIRARQAARLQYDQQLSRGRKQLFGYISDEIGVDANLFRALREAQRIETYPVGLSLVMPGYDGTDPINGRTQRAPVSTGVFTKALGYAGSNVTGKLSSQCTMMGEMPYPKKARNRCPLFV